MLSKNRSKRLNSIACCDIIATRNYFIRTKGKALIGRDRARAGVCRTAGDLQSAVAGAYEAASQVKWEGMTLRHDIGARALEILNKGND